MRKSLKRVGNSWVLVLGKDILGLLDINPVIDELELEIEKKKLIICKHKENKEKS